MINSVQEALKYFEKRLNIQIYSTLKTKDDKHRFILLQNKYNGWNKAYLLFKRESFKLWDKIFENAYKVIADFPDLERVDSINVDIYYEVLEKYSPDYFIIVYEDGSIYLKEPKDMLKNANDYQLYRKVKLTLENFKEENNEYKEETTLSFILEKKDVLFKNDK